MASGPEMLLWGEATDLRVLAEWLAGFAEAPFPTPLTRAGACVAVDPETREPLPERERIARALADYEASVA